MKNKRNNNISYDYGIVDKNNSAFEIPEGGSISLLALGYRGLMAWRNKRIEEYNKRNATNFAKDVR